MPTHEERPVQHDRTMRMMLVIAFAVIGGILIGASAADALRAGLDAVAAEVSP